MSSSTSSLTAKTPKNPRARREFKKRQPKPQEPDAKRAIFIRGHKSSSVLNNLLVDLRALKGREYGVPLNKKNKVLPFEDASPLEFLAEKNDAPLFALVNHTKKRPDNLTLGRLYNNQLLDMQEFQVMNYRSAEAFASEGNPQPFSHTRTALVFKGAQFESDERLVELRNLLTDFFRGAITEKVNLAGIDRLLFVGVVDADERRSQPLSIVVRTYHLGLKKSGSKVPRAALSEIGPSFSLLPRRTHRCAPELRKEAYKFTSGERSKKHAGEKNLSTTAFGERVGRLHMTRQDLEQMATRKFKGLDGRKGKARRKRSESTEQSEASSERPPAAKRSRKR